MYTSQNIFDSCYVDKDTVMYGNTYYKLNVIGFPLFTQLRGYIRDSMNYLVDRQGNILFASENFTDTFSSHYNIINSSDTLYFTFTKMEDNNLSITVPAGNFVTKNYKRTYIMCHNWAQAGTVRTINNRYAENVGLVEETLFFFSGDPNYTVKRLKRYGHI